LYEPHEIQISGSRTAADWKTFEERLVKEDSQELWAEAFEEYFKQRLELRYLKPIRILQGGGWQGEGFSIVTIQCALIEFLAATKIGKNHRHLKKKETLGEHEYSRSSGIFSNFLATDPAFQPFFDAASAEEFYTSVRCGLLHEARTKNGWTIWATSGGKGPIDPARKIVFRDDLQSTIDAFITDYGFELLSNKDLQAAFVRKFNNLAT
jgi:hypothetical protein